MSAAELESLQQQAWDEAYARGMAEGREAGRAEMREQAGRLRALCDALAGPLEEVDEAVLAELTQLSLDVARRVLCAELQVEPERVRNLVAAAVEAMPGRQRDLCVTLNPEDARIVRDGLDRSADEVEWRIRESAELARGECRVASENAQVDGTLAARIDAVAQELLEPSPRRGQDDV